MYTSHTHPTTPHLFHTVQMAGGWGGRVFESDEKEN
jgi:hypothetical protein